MRETDRYSSEARSVIAKILEIITAWEDDRLFATALLGLVANLFGGVYLNEIEEILRANYSRFYLVAVPINLARIEPISAAYLPQSGRKQYPYALSICIGVAELNSVNTEFNLHYNPEVNLQKLKITGFLMLPMGEEKAMNN